MPFLIHTDNAGTLIFNTDQIVSISENRLRPAGEAVSYNLRLSDGSSPLALNEQEYNALKAIIQPDAFPASAATKLHDRMSHI